MKNKQPRWILGMVLAVLSLQPAYAGFGVIDDTPSTDYGNGQTLSFRRAIEGGSPMSLEDQQQIAAMLPLKEEGRFYGRARMNFNSLILEDVKNRSGGTDSKGSVNKKRAVANQSGLELAVGYLWSPNFRGDIEYLVNKNLTYIANPGLTGTGVTTSQISSIIKNNTILANVYYDFAALERFKPYVTLGLGISSNSVESTLTPAPAAGGSKTLRAMRGAWGLGGGIRIGVFSHWYMDMSYRYIRLASGLNLKPNENYKLQSTYTANVMSVGFIYLF